MHQQSDSLDGNIYLQFLVKRNDEFHVNKIHENNMPKIQVGAKMINKLTL